MKSKFLPLLLLCAGTLWGQQVNMKSVTEKIPTYQIGAPEIDPIFFTGRVYQGAEGYIYPYPLYDVLTEKQVQQDYNVLRLDNQLPFFRRSAVVFLPPPTKPTTILSFTPKQE